MNNRLVIILENNTPDNEVLTFTSLVDVENHYGTVSSESTIAKTFFATNPSGTLSFTREGLGQRSHLIGANLSGDSLSQLQAINGPFSVTFNGNTYGSSVTLASATSFAEAATLITAAINYHLPVVATTTGSTITPETTNFTGSFSRAQLTVDSVQSGTVQVGDIISGSGVIVDPVKNQIIY
jgi:phage tail sheath gpL-like